MDAIDGRETTVGESAAPRVLIVARSAIARAGLRGIVAESGDGLVVGQAASTEDAARQIGALRPDLLLASLDADAPDEALALAETCAAQGVSLVLLGDAPDATRLSAFVRAGVRGVLLPGATADEVGAALRAATQGLLVLAPPLARSLVATPTRALSGSDDDGVAGEPLTDREREVLQLVAVGLPNKAIATRLKISEHTVKFHVGSIMAKLDAASRTEAVTRAARRGLLSL